MCGEAEKHRLAARCRPPLSTPSDPPPACACIKTYHRHKHTHTHTFCETVLFTLMAALIITFSRFYVCRLRCCWHSAAGRSTVAWLTAGWTVGWLLMGQYMQWQRRHRRRRPPDTHTHTHRSAALDHFTPLLCKSVHARARAFARSYVCGIERHTCVCVCVVYQEAKR